MRLVVRSTARPEALYTASFTSGLRKLPSMLARRMRLLSVMNISPSSGSRATSTGLVRLEETTMAWYTACTSNTSIFCPRASTT